ARFAILCSRDHRDRHSSPTRRSSDLKAASTFSRVTSKMGKLGKLLDKILEFFQKFGSKLVSLGEKLGVQPKNYGANVLDTVAERSEEHTSELQSRENLVCRLLLEKKK